jgi:PAS domain S-box-containing protein
MRASIAPSQFDAGNIMMGQPEFMPTAQVLRERVKALYRQGSQTGVSREVLEQAFDELELAVEALQSLEQRLQSRYETHMSEWAALEQSYQHYHELFADAPAGYIVTRLDGTIRHINRVAETLLSTDNKNAVGRSLANFIPDGQRRRFRARLAELCNASEPYIWRDRLQTADGLLFEATLCVSAARAPSGRPQSLRWLLISTHKHALADSPGGATSLACAREQIHHPDLVVAAGTSAQLFSVLAEASTLLAATDDLSAMVAQLAQLVVPALADGCIVDLESSAGSSMRIMATQTQTSGAASGDGTGPEAPATARKYPAQLLWLNNPDATEAAIEQLAHGEELRVLVRALHPNAAIVAPILRHGLPCGSLTLVASTAKRAYGPAETALVEELARRLGEAVERVDGQARANPSTK